MTRAALLAILFTACNPGGLTGPSESIVLELSAGDSATIYTGDCSSQQRLDVVQDHLERGKTRVELETGRPWRYSDGQQFAVIFVAGLKNEGQFFDKFSIHVRCGEPEAPSHEAGHVAAARMGHSVFCFRNMWHEINGVDVHLNTCR